MADHDWSRSLGKSSLQPGLVGDKSPVVLAGDFQMIPTELDAYMAERSRLQLLQANGIRLRFTNPPQQKRNHPLTPFTLKVASFIGQVHYYFFAIKQYCRRSLNAIV